MEALETKSYSLERMMWDYSRSVCRDLSRLYRKPFGGLYEIMTLPKVVLFDSTDLTKPMRVYPRRIMSQKANQIRSKVIERMAIGGTKAGYYLRDLLSFFYDTHGFQSIDDVTSSMTEEVTHHVIHYDEYGQIPVEIEELRVLNKTISTPNEDYGDRLIEILEDLDYVRNKPYIDFDLRPAISLDEFFVPISLAYVFRGKYHEIVKGRLKIPEWDYMKIYLPDGERKAYGKAAFMLDKVSHLSYYAGNTLVEAYDGDVEAIMEDHPDLARTPPRILWEQVVRPLLFEK